MKQKNLEFGFEKCKKCSRDDASDAASIDAEDSHKASIFGIRSHLYSVVYNISDVLINGFFVE